VAPDGALLAAPVEPHGHAWNAGTPEKVVGGRYLTTASGAGPPQIIVIQHFDEELTRLVPPK
jgi:hypothetical protein